MICLADEGLSDVFRARVQIELISKASVSVQHDGMVFNAQPALDLETLLLRALRQEWIDRPTVTPEPTIWY